MLSVTSEVGRLRRVLIHEPGPEVDSMVPAMMDELLFDDILFGDRAREEFGRFRRVLQLLGVEVHDAFDLLVEILLVPEARDWLLDVVLADLPGASRARLEEATAERLASLLVEGLRHDNRPTALEADLLFEIPPLPNWFFQRDPQVVIGSGVVFAAMAAPARHREAVIARALFRHHPMLAAAAPILDPLEQAPERRHLTGAERADLEGGDLLVLSPEILVVGLSERTNRTGVQSLWRALARRDGGPRWLIAVEIPRRRAYMHIDTLMTPVDRNACLVHAPVLLPGGPEPARVWELDLHAKEISPVLRRDLLSALSRRGLDLEPISCGGLDPVAQRREQWTDGANALALAPGVILLYDRNVATIEELSRRGFRVLEAEDLLLGREEVDLDAPERVCILLSSHEICRARGGPHCLAHPLLRDPAG